MSDAAVIASWMLEEIRAAAPRKVRQQTLVHKMREKFGHQWSYTNRNGHQAFDRAILKEFGELKDEFVYWDRADQTWRVVDQERLNWIRERDALRKERAAERARIAAERAEAEGD